MSKQEWSKEVPVEDGWYWVRDENWGKDSEEILFVYELMGDMIIKSIGEEAHDIIGEHNAYRDCEWLGPLTPPE